ncbi:hypothetical protein JCM10295v2_006316 [Rhodotorula toruloides]
MHDTWVRSVARDHSPSIPVSSQTLASHTRTQVQRGPATREDDQQISQILAEMSQHQEQQGGSVSPPAQPHASTSASSALEGIPVGLPGPMTTTGSSSIDPLLNPMPLPVPPPLPPLATIASTSDAKGKGNAAASVGGAGGTGVGTKSRGRGKSDERLQMKEEDWERSRKANHKEVERKRRETINQGISNLAALLPSELLTQPASPLTDSASPCTSTSNSKSSKAAKETTNKSTILGLTQSYILQLKASEQRIIEKWTLEKLLMEQRVKEVEGEREEWRKRAEMAEAEVKRLRGGSSGEGTEGARERKRARVEDGEAAPAKAQGNGAKKGA